LPTVGFSLWPCAWLLIVFIPVSVFHERNWRRALASYAEMRREAGASDADWPTADQRIILGAQPWLLLLASTILGLFSAFALWALLQWPRIPAGFELPINYYDLAYLWTVLVMSLAAVAIGVAIGLDALRSPWAGVAWRLRRSMYAPEEVRSRMLAEALACDPGIPHDREATSVDDVPRGDVRMPEAQ
jgi:hypothetical protein